MVEAAFDLHRLEEDDRIALMGKSAEIALIAACVEYADGKSDRYVKKMLERFPKVRLVDRKPFDKARTIELLQFGPAIQH